MKPTHSQFICCHYAEYYNNDYASNSLLHITKCFQYFQSKLLYLLSFRACPISSLISPFNFTRVMSKTSPPILSADKQVVYCVCTSISWKSVYWRVWMSVIHDCQPTYNHICNPESIIRYPTLWLWINVPVRVLLRIPSLYTNGFHLWNLHVALKFLPLFQLQMFNNLTCSNEHVWLYLSFLSWHSFKSKILLESLKSRMENKYSGTVEILNFVRNSYTASVV